MPQAVAKSKAGKKGHESSAHATIPPAQDVKVEESRPRRSAQTLWTNILTQEDTDEAVGEIMDDLMGRVMEGCLKVDKKRQLIPFTVSWAVSQLTKTVEQHFMHFHIGEQADEVSRTEDAEPMPTPIDSWAQGCVPVITADHPSHDTSLQEPKADRADPLSKIGQPLDGVVQTTDSAIQSDEEPHPGGLVREKLRNMRSSVPPQNTRGKKKQQDGGRLLPSTKHPVPPQNTKGKKKQHDGGRLLPSLSCSTEQKAVKVKDKNEGKSVSDSMTGSLHQEKGCKLIPKLDPLQLPRNYIFPQFEIVDSSHTKSHSQDHGGLFRLSTRHNKKQAKQSGSLKPLNSSNNDLGKFQKKSSPGSQRTQTESSEPVKLDTVTLTEGVSLLKHQAEDIKPLTSNLPPQSNSMRLIRNDVAMPLLSVDDVVSGPPPQVTILHQPKTCNN